MRGQQMNNPWYGKAVDIPSPPQADPSYAPFIWLDLKIVQFQNGKDFSPVPSLGRAPGGVYIHFICFTEENKNIPPKIK